MHPAAENGSGVPRQVMVTFPSKKMNKEKTKKVKFGNPGFFLILSIVLLIICMCTMGGGMNRLKAFVAIFSMFGSGIVVITGLIVSIVRWNQLTFLGKLSFYVLLVFIILFGFMIIPAL